MRWKRKNRVITEEEQEEIRTKDFFDLITPSALRFSPDTTFSVIPTAGQRIRPIPTS